LALGVNTANGHITNGPVAEFLGEPLVHPLTALG
jgi:hypothetical protein